MTLKPAGKAAVVLGGYASALLIALLVVRIYIGATSGPARDASSGMFAFGDMLAFLAAFGLAAVPPTCAAFYFLRSHPGFWRPFSAFALVLAATVLIALVIHLGSMRSDPGSPQPAWSAYATLRILAAPLCSLAFLLAGLCAPNRPARLALLGAAFVEGAAFAVIASTWVYQAIRG